MIELDIIWVSSLSGDEPNVTSKDISWGEQIHRKSGDQQIPGTFEGQLEPVSMTQLFLRVSLYPFCTHGTSPGFWGVKERDPLSLVATRMTR